VPGIIFNSSTNRPKITNKTSAMIASLLLGTTLLALSATGHARHLEEESSSSLSRRLLAICTSSSTSYASSFAEDAIAEAVTDAFAQCSTCPCTNQAQGAASVTSTAIAETLATTQLQVVASDPGCQVRGDCS
jgi:hypothetical protein